MTDEDIERLHAAANPIDTLRAQNAELLAALENLLEVCACQNGCAPDDMTCATNAARAAIQRATGGKNA